MNVILQQTSGASDLTLQQYNMKIIGHQKQWQFLKKSAELEKLPHGLLFCGQEQLGKKTLAIEFIKFLNCQFLASTGEAGGDDFSKRPCQTCRSCRDIQEKVYPDFVLIEPESSRGEIRISQIRDLIGKLSLRPYASIFKTAILDRAHLMTREAQSCFLKLLEEPKGKALLILITEYPEMLLSTILSRVQKIRFSPVRSIEIRKYLIQQKIAEDKAEYFAFLSLGRPGAAINFLSDPQKVENQKKLVADLVKISNSDLAFRFQYAKGLSDLSIDNLREILDTWLRHLRIIFLSRLSQKYRRQEKTESFSRHSLSKLKDIIKLIQSTNFLLSTTNINPRLALEILLIEL